MDVIQITPIYLLLDNFKIYPCDNKKPHNHKRCEYYHYMKDRKRPGSNYSFTLCPYIEQNLNCPLGDTCPDSHSVVEQLYRHEKYKKKFCSHYPNDLHNCEYGSYCSFAHYDDEIKLPLIHKMKKNIDFFCYIFKTIMCPFNSSFHDKSLCVYAHNCQDLRRNYNEFKYQAALCPYWDIDRIILNYADGCPYGINCKLCHGWKEFDYHPMIYKTRPCQKLTCNNIVCSKFHDENDVIIRGRNYEKEICNNEFSLINEESIMYSLQKRKKNEEHADDHDIQIFLNNSNTVEETNMSSSCYSIENIKKTENKNSFTFTEINEESIVSKKFLSLELLSGKRRSSRFLKFFEKEEI